MTEGKALAAESDPNGWVSTILGAVGLTSTGLGGWILSTSNRQARLESKLDSLKESTEKSIGELKESTAESLEKIETSVGKIVKHITGIDL